MSEYSEAEKYPASGFTQPDGKPAYLFSSDNHLTVQRHFNWMRDYGIDGVWLQHFVVDLPGGPSQDRYPSRMRVIDHVREAAKKTGRVWALAYDISGSSEDRIYQTIATDWKKMVDDKIIQDPNYIHEGGLPVVQIWGFYHQQKSTPMSAQLANKLIEFFQTPSPYSAFLVAGGDWNWRKNPDKEWRQFLARFRGYSPWNVGNYSIDTNKVTHASMGYWEEDFKECQQRGTLWIPVIYPGFSWDNLRQQKPGTSTLARREGRFLWEQFYELARLKADSVCVAMFDEVDEGTAIFKVSDTPPKEAHFQNLEGLPSDWYLRLVGEGTKMLRGQRPLSAELPFPIPKKPLR
ncbi:hypothetical protein KIH39_09955 [Telmatocola sphagniphila]|uniref:Xylosidase/arabinosidase n=1 Tax=Telmatocola sphagniphila TaxID=1123043 RepID=A0A8E6EWW1_9BACT|nr:hypothetical protein [Telmatocola sphagniphila]QVL34207.1 hypothetical protein KIH39_09955 [Telmatocola sphagniphila]